MAWVARAQAHAADPTAPTRPVHSSTNPPHRHRCRSPPPVQHHPPDQADRTDRTTQGAHRQHTDTGNRAAPSQHHRTTTTHSNDHHDSAPAHQHQRQQRPPATMTARATTTTTTTTTPTTTTPTQTSAGHRDARLRRSGRMRDVAGTNTCRRRPRAHASHEDRPVYHLLFRRLDPGRTSRTEV